MHMLLLLLMLGDKPATGAIEVTVRGTAQPLEIELSLRDENDEWTAKAHQALPASARRARFENLEAGVYQILVRGPQPSELFAVKTVIGSGDTRRAAVDIEPFTLTGRITLGGADLGGGGIVLRHKEFHYRAAVPVGANGTFKATLWQRGAFTASVRGPALTTAYLRPVEIGDRPLAIDIPDGRVHGVVRDAKTKAPVANALVLLSTRRSDGENMAKLTTKADGQFDFVGVDHGRQSLRVLPPAHLEPEPIAFTIDGNHRLHELDLALDAGHRIDLVAIDRENDPIDRARVFAVVDGRIASRTTTDEDGIASVAVPAGRPATLFVIGPEGPFGMQRVGRSDERGRVQVHLPRSSSSLLIRALTTDGRAMPPFSLLMRFNGELVPPEIADELAAIQGLRLGTNGQSEARLNDIPSGSYEFWPYRTDEEAESILAAGAVFPPIQVDVRSGENKIAVKFAAR